MSTMKRHMKNRSFKHSRKPGSGNGKPFVNVAQTLQRSKQAKEKYLQLARESLAAGDRVQAESYFQHADHYIRVINMLERERDDRSATEEVYYNTAIASEPEQALPEATEAFPAPSPKRSDTDTQGEFLPAFLLTEA